MQGTWKKYEKDNEKDLKTLEADLKGAFPNCSNDLMAFSYIADGTMSGDIHVFYNKDGKPLFYIKYREDPSDKTYYLGWCGTGNLPLIPPKYLNIVVPKIKELDKDHKYLDIIQKYEAYKKLLKIARKKSLSGEDLIFLYDHLGISLARDILGGKTKNHTTARKMQDDYDNLEEKEKVAFIVMLSEHYNYYKKKEELKVNDSKILILAASYAGYKVLPFISKELLENEDFILEFLKVAPPCCYWDNVSMLLMQFLPIHFFDNKRVLSSIFAWHPEFIFEMGHYEIFKGDVIYKENGFYPDPSRRFRNAMEQDVEFQETILQSILYGLLKQDIKFLKSTLLSWWDILNEEYHHELQFDVNDSSYFAQQLFYYFDRDILKNAIEKFYGPFQEEDKSHQNHDRLVLVQKFVQKLSKIK